MGRWFARGWDQLDNGMFVWPWVVLGSLLLTAGAAIGLHAAGWSHTFVSIPLLLPSFELTGDSLDDLVFSASGRLLSLWLAMGAWRVALTQPDGGSPFLTEMARVDPLGFLQACALGLACGGAEVAMNAAGTSVAPVVAALGAWSGWVLGSVWIVVATVAWVWLPVRLLFVLPLLALGTPLPRALRESWRATSGHTIQLALFMAGAAVVSLVGLLVIGVGVLFSGGFLYTSLAAAFQELVGELPDESAAQRAVA